MQRAQVLLILDDIIPVVKQARGSHDLLCAITMLPTYPARPAPRPSMILRPGEPTLGPNVERYRIAGGGSLVVQAGPGDLLVLTDIEGGQPGQISFCDESGRCDLSAIGGRADSRGEELKLLLAAPAAVRTLAALRRRNIDIARLETLRLFGTDSTAGSRAEFKVARAGLLIAAAPGADMQPCNQDTATDLELRVVRARGTAARADVLPEPLADTLQDLRVRAATATAYRVKAGEFIQVIDVAGRQCSDFQAFALRNVELGLDLGLDATVTRSLVGRSYPAPGLLSKAFDRSFAALVEIVQDTVGRHDFFGTACSARYYDDQGYPGHVNCSDNFNAALAPFGIAPRKGWEAINYFYNTGIDQQNQIILDEPWSRPGDYVLMRALTDLVCVSSACPDDIDAANGWDPTDIHVRTYSSQQVFSTAVAYRMNPESEAALTRETAFHPRFAALTRHYTEYRGYWLPARFTGDGPVEEYWACRERVALADLSPLRKFEVTGPDAEALLQYCLTRDLRRLAVGQVVYTAMCYENGGMLDDGTVFRLGLNNFRWIGGDDYSGQWLREQAAKQGYQVWVRSSTDQLHNLAVQGPRSRELLREIIWTAPAQPGLAELGWFRFTVGRIGHYEGAPVVVSRTGYTGELGYEIFCHPKDALSVFDAVWQAGQKYDLRPLGLEALDMLRIEAGLIAANFEFTSETDPFEAGVGFCVPLATKADDFIGKAALVERQGHPRRKLVGLEIDANEAVGHGDCVHSGRARIGVVTSGTRSPILGKTIALARIDAANAVPGNPVEIGKLDGRQKRLPGRIVAPTHYDPEKRRPRA